MKFHVSMNDNKIKDYDVFREGEYIRTEKPLTSLSNEDVHIVPGHEVRSMQTCDYWKGEEFLIHERAYFPTPYSFLNPHTYPGLRIQYWLTQVICLSAEDAIEMLIDRNADPEKWIIQQGFYIELEGDDYFLICKDDYDEALRFLEYEMEKTDEDTDT